ncbi:FliA/WhiG family RNA polymerase sigma factor [Pedococcus bigeumensis]|uniref:sigma-70 family RNA polymerase sigma factor n=1 Tax=Pedococcus bigeumensis TaxID=433644 RepID=UPI002FEC7750
MATAPDRETLIVAHIPLVRYVAGRMMPNLHASVEYQDLVSYGMFGLIDAIEKFDLSAGTRFSTFATYRIRGAITDEMRDQAWEPRSVRARSRQVAQAATDLEVKLGRPATEQELATHVDLSIPELRRVESDLNSARVASLTAPRGESEDGATLGDYLVSMQDTTDLLPQVSEAADLLATAMEMLPENDRILISLIYIKGMALKEIARLLDVTKSWVSLLHSRVTVVGDRGQRCSK